jgi:two-component system sensor histidine kinase BaeS
VIAQEAVRLSELTSALLTLAKLDAGMAQPRCQAVDETMLLEAIDTRFALTAASAGIVLVTEPGGGRPRADFDRLLQAASVIIDNAIAYTPTGGRVLVSTEHEKRTWKLHVDDSGPGIAPEHREVVFRRFKRLEDSRSTDTGGAGLGLSLALRLVESMGGTIGIEDSILGGSRFTVTLPLADRDHA